MQEKRNRQDEIRSWIKATLGLVLLCLNIFIRKDSIEKEKKKEEDKKNFHQSDVKTINMNTPAKENIEEENKEKEAKGWLKAQPEKLPEPTYWPFFLAMGLVFLFWGIITSWIIVLVGLLIFIISLAGWINILRHER